MNAVLFQKNQMLVVVDLQNVILVALRVYQFAALKTQTLLVVQVDVLGVELADQFVLKMGAG
jgi:hypothetical protein